MSFKDFDINCWYMSNDYQDLYSIRKEGPGLYKIVKFFNCEGIFSGTITECKLFISKICMDHYSYINGKKGFNNAK